MRVMFTSLKHNPYYGIQVAPKATAAGETEQVNKTGNIKTNGTQTLLEQPGKAAVFDTFSMKSR